MDDQLLWGIVAALGSLALLVAVINDRRIRNRKRLDQVGIMPWPLIAIFALFILSIAIAKLLGFA